MYSIDFIKIRNEPKGQFTRYDFVACDKLTTGLRHELFRVNQTYNSLTTVMYITKNVVGIGNDYGCMMRVE